MLNDLSKRDWFAGMALQGLLARDTSNVAATGTDQARAFKHLAEKAYHLADAMLAVPAKAAEAAGAKTG